MNAGAAGERPHLSVVVLAYNHAKYIARALDGVLAQQVDFPIEILVGEDGSSDGTRDLVRRYERAHPDIIKARYNDRDKVIYMNGWPTGRRNLIDTLGRARGELVAMLEGDDFWTDETKLQRQADALAAHPECSLCFHNAEILFESGERRAFTDLEGEQRVGIDRVLAGWMVPTASMVFRRRWLGELPPWFTRVMSGDYSIQLLLAHKGPFYYLDRYMSVYRKHTGGLSARTGTAWFRRNLTLLLEEFNEQTDGQYEHLIVPRLVERYRETASLSLAHNNNPFLAYRDLRRALRYEATLAPQSAADRDLSTLRWAGSSLRGLFRKFARRLPGLNGRLWFGLGKR